MAFQTPSNRADISLSLLKISFFVLLVTAFMPSHVLAQAGTGCGPWVVVGDATPGAPITLTTATANQKGGAWASSCIDISKSFNMTFKAYFGAAAGADGIDFVLQNDPRGTAALGGIGGNKGYTGTGIGVTPSVDFDLETFGSSYVGVEENASGQYVTVGVSPVTLYTFPSSVSDNTEHTYNVTWDAVGHNLTLIFDGTTILTYNRDLVNQVFSGTTCVYYGFTAGTGGGGNNVQYIYGVNCFTSTPTPTPTNTSTPTVTPTPTITLTPTNTTTPLPTNTPTITPTPAASPNLPGPNPFTPSLSTNNVVQFNLSPSHSAGTLSIYDLRRWPVRKMDFAAGAPVTWDGKNESGQLVQGGVYLYLLGVDSAVHRGSITVLK